MLVNTCGTIAAAAMPWIARKPTSAAALGQAARGGGEGEADQADEEEAAAEAVAEAGAGHQRDAEGQRVCRDDPLQHRPARAESTGCVSWAIR
ncbi:hypothetical protein GCM10028781_01460 [Nostocoides australiense]